MATQIGGIINAARNRDAAFHPRRVPNSVVLSYLSDVQSSMLTKAAELDRNRVAIQCNIAFATTPGNTPGTVGAGAGGGLPAGLDGQSIEALGQDTGPTIELDVDNAPILVPDTVVASATANDVTLSGVNWVVNQWANKVAYVSAGQGYFQKRIIISNTANKLVISDGADGQQWQTIPDVTSVVRVLDYLLVVDEKLSVVTELPPFQQVSGYLVKLNAQGQPYLDIANPIVVKIDAGIPLPTHQTLIGGSVRVKSTQGLDPLTAKLTIRSYQDRYHWGPTYTCWTENDQLFLSGSLSDWANAVSIDLRLVPDPPDFVALTDYILLPDFAGQMLVAAGAYFMARRCAKMKDVDPIDVEGFKEEWKDAQDVFLAAFGSSQRAFAKYIHEVW